MNATVTMRNIEALDLEAIKRKLMHEESGEGWSAERAERIAKEYRRFLFMMQQYPQQSFAPLVDVDTFWHYHILDTRKYAADCQQTFGYFLNHHPYVGLDAGDDAANAAEHAQYGERMRELYQASFGEACPAAGAAWCAVAAAANDTAWCALTAPAKDTAWCAVAATSQGTAWCAVAAKPAATAWCAVSAKAGNTAWCAVAATPKTTAWCAVAAGANDTAWCAVSSKSQDTAWCAAAGSADQVQTVAGAAALPA